MVQAALDNRGISTGCSILAIPISISIAVVTLVLCRLLGIGAFSGVVTFVTALKADNIGLGVEVVVVVSSWTVVVIGTVVVVWAVWISVAWGWWFISRLGCWWKSAGLLVT